MLRTKFIISSIIFIIFLIITSAVKNETRILEKKITNLSNDILLKRKDINETQLDFYYLYSPKEVEKKINIIGLYDYSQISNSKIFLNISDITKTNNKISNLKK